MRLLLPILIIFLFLMACAQTTAPELEKTEEAPNIAPTVIILGGDTIIENGQNHLLTAEVDDPDVGDMHSYQWSIDGIEQLGETESAFLFSKSPEIETVYAVQIIISDGEAEGQASVSITVLESPWTPEPWHIYILDAADTILFDYVAANLTDYYYMLQAVKLKVEIHNRDFVDQWHWIAGGTS